MKFFSYSDDGKDGLGIVLGGDLRGLPLDKSVPEWIELLEGGEELLKRVANLLADAPALDPEKIRYRPVLSFPRKIICVGLNYANHTAETPYSQPDYPTFFPRFASTLVGHQEPIIRPRLSEELDYEGELAVVIGTGGRYISKAAANDHIFGYSIFNEASIRDYQFKTPQWTAGKNFDDSGAFGPFLLTRDQLPEGAKGLQLTTRLNGEVMQSGNTNDLIFDIPTLIATISEVLTLQAGDVIVSGTPAGIGWARKPPLWMKHGDVCEVEIEGIGTLSNPIRDE
jgi:2-keto-4-pentenoate hydratase/2-oxohepta-3-ene-1,7-dioic acid hydratase in catechol pathway